MDYIRWFHEITATEVELVGGKGANLGEMARANFPVPPGFCLIAQAIADPRSDGSGNCGRLPSTGAGTGVV